MSPTEPCREHNLLSSKGVNTRLAIVNDNLIGKVGSHDEIVLDDERCTSRRQDETLDDFRGSDTLFGVKVGGGLIDQVDVCRETQGQNNGDSLQFSTRQTDPGGNGREC